MNRGLSEELKKAFPNINLSKRSTDFSKEIKDPQ
jgi:hypothetical protein